MSDLQSNVESTGESVLIRLESVHEWLLVLFDVFIQLIEGREHFELVLVLSRLSLQQRSHLFLFDFVQTTNFRVVAKFTLFQKVICRNDL